MSTELAKKKRKQQKLEKGKQKKPLDQIKYLPGQDGQNLRECVCVCECGAEQHLTVSFVVLLCKKSQSESRTTTKRRPSQPASQPSKEPRHKNQTRNG